MLQRYISAGQVIGLAIAGLLARSRPGAGFIECRLGEAGGSAMRRRKWHQHGTRPFWVNPSKP